MVITNNWTNWIWLALASAILFGLGDFTVVYSEDKGMDVLTLYVLYTIIVGVVNFIYLAAVMSPSTRAQITKYGRIEWFVVAAFCVTYLFAYLLHFIAIQRASNPGYASALVSLCSA